MFKSIILISIAGIVSLAFAQSGELLQTFNEPIEDNKLVFHNSINKNQLSKSDELKILVWNVYKFQKDNIFKDLNNFAKDNNFLILQENHLTDQVNSELSSNYLTGLHHITAPSFIHKGFPTGVTISTKYSYSYSYSLRSTVTEPIIKTPKMSLYTYFHVLGLNQPLLMISVHGINFVSTSKFKIHMEQIFSEINQHDGPIILAGDFNTHASSRTKYFTNEVKKYGLKLLNPEIDERKLKLDHILIRGLKSKSIKLRTDITSSDHPPIEARLIFDDNLNN